ncbi:NifB/NifX family molybdenum-iron cluster-binding protein [Mariniflexile ostreae]|uniref:NifB/NifX family molybdenum-iron cluster-binding protein n=1 Tax=Mariniflexile ostreae TaxID=1520892 RepID=A0ABV5F8Y8_9FLAO
MKKIAVPITRNNQIEMHFGHCKFYEIYTFSNSNVILDLQLLESVQGCDAKSKLFNRLATNGVTYMLSGEIGNKALGKLKHAGIHVVRGCSGDAADTVLRFIESEISDNV